MGYNVIIGRLRGISILAVVILHYAGSYPSIFDFLGRGQANGYYGVTVFFVVSGFLITSHILRRYGEPAQARVVEFYVMRFARIVPMLALTLALLSFLAFWGVEHFKVGSLADYLRLMSYVLTFRYNLYIEGPPAWTVLWSLSIEEFFYVLFPLLGIATQNRRSLLAVLGALVVLGPIYRAVGQSSWTSLYACYGCFDAIALGALTAFAADAFASKLTRARGWGFLLSGSGILAVAYFGTVATTNYIIGPTVAALGAACILLASQGRSLSALKTRAFDPLAFAGRFSYEIYLLHLMVFCLLRPFLFGAEMPPLILFIVVFSAVLMLSFVAGAFYSEPLNKRIRAAASVRLKGRWTAGAEGAGLGSLVQ